MADGNGRIEVEIDGGGNAGGNSGGDVAGAIGDDLHNDSGVRGSKRGRGRPPGAGNKSKSGAGNSGGTAPLKSGATGAGDSGRETAREEGTTRPSERGGSGKPRGNRASGTKKASSNQVSKAAFIFVNKLFVKLEADDLCFTDDEQKEWREAWEPFAEHWLPDFGGEINPKWAALGVMMWTLYCMGAPRLEGLNAIKTRRMAGKKAPPGKGPIVDVKAESPPAPAVPDIFSVNAMGDAFAPFGGAA